MVKYSQGHPPKATCEMVRVLSCYHFRGQKIGRCEEATALTVADQSIVVAIEDSLNVYNTGHVPTASVYDTGSRANINSHIPEIGVPICFGNVGKSSNPPGEEGRLDNEQHQSGSCSSSVSSAESDTEVKLSHSFSTVNLVRNLSYNKKGTVSCEYNHD